jgi:hypothetical protein
MGTEQSHSSGDPSHGWHWFPPMVALCSMAAWVGLLFGYLGGRRSGDHAPTPVQSAVAAPEFAEPEVVPATGFRGEELVGLPPGVVGLHVDLPPADYRYVPVFRDDASDVRTACWLQSIVDPGPDVQPGREIDGCGPGAAQFVMYVAGRELAESGNPSGARAVWRSLLAMPPADRAWRSTWAAFMLGSSYRDEDPAEAIGWFRRTRELAAEGFADSLGLANASLGWEAYAELNLGNHPRAIRLYLEHRAAGDPTADASLDSASRQALREPVGRLAEYARDPVLRAVISDSVATLADRYPREYATALRDRWREALALADLQPPPAITMSSNRSSTLGPSGLAVAETMSPCGALAEPLPCAAEK